MSLNEKLKSAKSDLARKDQIIGDYKDKMLAVQNEVGNVKDSKAEVDRLRDISKKQKLDLEVKENQVRSLKSQLSSHKETLNTMSIRQEDWNQSEEEFESHLKAQKLKTKRYENYLRKSITALKKIGTELVALQQ